MFDSTLNDLGRKYNTDKSDIIEVSGQKTAARDYLKYYELFMKDFRNESFTFIELGCYKGNSLKLWKEYFKKATIVGIDISSEYKVEENRVEFICEDATDEKLIPKLNKYKGTINFIIDDCSHAWSSQRISLERLFPLLNSGGYYIIEDLEFGCKGDTHFNKAPKILDSQPFFEYILERAKILRFSRNYDRKKGRPYFKLLPEHIQKLELSIEMITIISGAIIIKKI